MLAPARTAHPRARTVPLPAAGPCSTGACRTGTARHPPSRQRLDPAVRRTVTPGSAPCGEERARSTPRELRPAALPGPRHRVRRPQFGIFGRVGHHGWRRRGARNPATPHRTATTGREPVSLALCHPASPRRAADWRWRTATRLRGGLLPTRCGWVDTWVERAVAFQAALDDRGGGPHHPRPVCAGRRRARRGPRTLARR